MFLPMLFQVRNVPTKPRQLRLESWCFCCGNPFLRSIRILVDWKSSRMREPVRNGGLTRTCMFAWGDGWRRKALMVGLIRSLKLVPKGKERFWGGEAVKPSWLSHLMYPKKTPPSFPAACHPGFFLSCLSSRYWFPPYQSRPSADVMWGICAIRRGRWVEESDKLPLGLDAWKKADLSGTSSSHGWRQGNLDSFPRSGHPQKRDSDTGPCFCGYS